LRRLPLLAVLLLALGGCASPATPGRLATGTPSSGPTVAASVAAVVKLGDYDSRRDPAVELKAAMSAAKQDHHNVLVDFGADWCPDCRVLARLGADARVAPLLAGYHVVSVDVGRFDRNLGMAAKLSLRLSTSGIPALVVIAPNGRVRVATNDGSFADARTMTAAQFAAFLRKWR